MVDRSSRRVDDLSPKLYLISRFWLFHLEPESFCIFLLFSDQKAHILSLIPMELVCESATFLSYRLILRFPAEKRFCCSEALEEKFFSIHSRFLFISGRRFGRLVWKLFSSKWGNQINRFLWEWIYDWMISWSECIFNYENLSPSTIQFVWYV